MKNLFKYATYTLLAAIALTACTDKYEYDGVGEAENENASGVFFASSNPTKTIELEPGSEEFDLTLVRANAESAQTVKIEVLSDEAGVFVVPETAEFAAGSTTATLHITAPNAEEGAEYSLTIGIAEDQQNIYGTGAQSYTANVAIQKWEDLGTGYLVDGTISTWYGVDPTLAFSVNLQKLEMANGFRLRFVGPYSHPATAMDDLGAFNGYPYNLGTRDGQDYTFVIDVTPAGASLAPVCLGIDEGSSYGYMWIGSIYGNLSTNITAYPLGIYDEAAGVITFPLNSLFIQDNDGPSICNKNPTYLYLSADAYIASMDE